MSQQTLLTNGSQNKNHFVGFFSPIANATTNDKVGAKDVCYMHKHAHQGKTRLCQFMNRSFGGLIAQKHEATMTNQWPVLEAVWSENMNIQMT